MTGYDELRVRARTIDEDLDIVSAPLESMWKLAGWVTYPLVIDDLDDGRQSIRVRSGREEDHTADLDQLPSRGAELDVTHRA